MVYGEHVDFTSHVRWYDMTVQRYGARRTAGHHGHGVMESHHLLNKRRKVTESVQVATEIYTGCVLLAILPEQEF